VKSLREQGLRIADTRDFEEQAARLDAVGDADTLVFPEVGAAVISGGSFRERNLAAMDVSDESPVETIEPEYFAFAENDQDRYLQGFRRAVETIALDLGTERERELDEEVDPAVVGATWGLIACKVPPSSRTGLGIKVAVLDTGMDLGHADFAGRSFTTGTFVGQPVQDLHGHGTHCIGTACGPKAPAGATPRYGIGYRTLIFVGKVLSNSGSGSTASVLAGMNWAIANRCPVISMSLGAQTPVQAAYTQAGAQALAKGLLIIAAAGNASSTTGAPANSPTIMSVASLDQNLSPSNFSNFGKIEIAAPGRDVFSSWPRPTRYRTISGTSMATPHVAGCASLWAQTSPALRGAALWKKLQVSAKPLPFPPSRVGKGLVQAPA
jgi:subtilisin